MMRRSNNDNSTNSHPVSHQSHKHLLALAKKNDIHLHEMFPQFLMNFLNRAGVHLPLYNQYQHARTPAALQEYFISKSATPPFEPRNETLIRSMLQNLFLDQDDGRYYALKIEVQERFQFAQDAARHVATIATTFENDENRCDLVLKELLHSTSDSHEIHSFLKDTLQPEPCSWDRRDCAEQFVTQCCVLRNDIMRNDATTSRLFNNGETFDDDELAKLHVSGRQLFEIDVATQQVQLHDEEEHVFRRDLLKIGMRTEQTTAFNGTSSLESESSLFVLNHNDMPTAFVGIVSQETKAGEVPPAAANHCSVTSEMFVDSPNPPQENLHEKTITKKESKKNFLRDLTEKSTKAKKNNKAITVVVFPPSGAVHTDGPTKSQSESLESQKEIVDCDFLASIPFSILENSVFHAMLASEELNKSDKKRSKDLWKSTRHGHFSRAVSQLSLLEWVDRCSSMTLSEGESEVMNRVFPEKTRDAPTTMSQRFQRFVLFCRFVACRPFYVVCRNVFVNRVIGGSTVAELDIALFDITMEDNPVLVAVGEVKDRAADIVVAQHQRVCFVEAVQGSCKPEARKKLQCDLITKDDNETAAARAFYESLKGAGQTKTFPGEALTTYFSQHDTAIPRWFYVMSAYGGDVCPLTILPSKVTRAFLDYATTYVARKSRRPLNASIRFHSRYFRKCCDHQEQLQTWMDRASKALSHSEMNGLSKELCQVLDRMVKALPDHCTPMAAVSPLFVLAELLDHGVVSNLIVKKITT